jgi:hypothetical protein
MFAKILQGGIGACVGVVAGMAINRHRSIIGVSGDANNSTVNVDVTVQEKKPLEGKIFSDQNLTSAFNLMAGCLFHGSVTKEMKDLLKEVGVTDSAKISSRFRSLVVWQPHKKTNFVQRWIYKAVEKVTGPINSNLGAEEVSYATLMYLKAMIAPAHLRRETRTEIYHRHTTGVNIPTTTVTKKDDGTEITSNRANDHVLFESVHRVLEYYRNASLSLYPWIRLPWTRRQVLDAIFSPGEVYILDIVYAAYLSTILRPECVHSATGTLYKFSREMTTTRARDLMSAAQWVLSMDKEMAKSEDEMMDICLKTHPNQHDEKNVTHDCSVLLAAYRFNKSNKNTYLASPP